MIKTRPAVLADSPLGRLVPRCRYFGTCGGCRWQDVDYAEQLRTKDTIVADHLRGLADPAALRPIIPAPSVWYYRNKMEFTFGPPANLGLHERGQWRRIVNLDECFLQSEISAAIVHDVRAFVAARGVSCYDPRERRGLLRSLVIREARASGEMMVGVVTTPGAFGERDAFVQMLTGRFPTIVSIVRGTTAVETMEIADVDVLFGRPHIIERVAGLEFAIGLSTFFQANTVQAEGMVALVGEFAALDGSEEVVDLYCGVGTFALALARRARHVTGLDTEPRSIEAARENAAANGMTNVEFYAADARALTVIAGAPRPDVLVLDPPRAGAGPKVVRQIGRLRPERIVYVSCNPVTLASDLRALTTLGYVVTAVQPVDQFPHTSHVECVVQASKEVAA